MKSLVQIAGVVVFLALGALGAFALVKAGERPDAQPTVPPPPLVETLALVAQDVPVSVRAQGTVRPRTESALVPEVSGRVTWVSPSLAAGGFFEQGELLLKLDARDFELALARREAAVAQAQLRLEQVRADAAIARREWESMGEGEASPLALREPQLAEARAALAAAEAELEAARRELGRTRLRAPFAGRVRDESVDRGQFVSRGQALASLYAIDTAEVRVPLPDEELAFLDLPLVFRGDAARSGPEVLLRARFAGREQTWQGRLVRTEGELDPRSRMVHAVVEVEDPYSRSEAGGRPPLAVGLFVEVEILGRVLERVHVVPRSSFRQADELVLVDAEDRLRLRRVEVLRTERDFVIVGGGLQDGERACVTPLAAVTDGMRVRTQEVGRPEADLRLERVGS